MKRITSLFLIFLILTLVGCKKEAKSQKFTDYTFEYFDTVTTIIGYEETEEIFKKNCEKIKTELYKYHKLYDIYKLYSNENNLASINATQNGGHAKLTVDKEIIDLIAFSKEIYTKTNGKVNIAFGSVLSIWHNFREDGLNNPESATLPEKKTLDEAAKHTNIDDVIIDKNNNTVYLKDSKMSLDVGAIAKGYAVEAVAQFMKKNGFTSYILNVGGNVRTLDKKPDGKNYTVGIENPDKSDTENPYIEYLSIENMSLVTSGNYQRYYTVAGKNYNHIIDTTTLYPAENFVSVSVLCESSALADAYSTALFCMSYDEGKRLVKETDGLEAIWVLENGDKKYSDGFKKYTVKKP